MFESNVLKANLYVSNNIENRMLRYYFFVIFLASLFGLSACSGDSTPLPEVVQPQPPVVEEPTETTITVNVVDFVSGAPLNATLSVL